MRLVVKANKLRRIVVLCITVLPRFIHLTKPGPYVCDLPFHEMEFHLESDSGSKNIAKAYCYPINHCRVGLIHGERVINTILS